MPDQPQGAGILDDVEQMDKVQHEYVTIRDTLLDFFEGDPLDMKIDKIKLLNKTNYIFDTDLNQEKSDLKPWQNRRNRDKIIKEELTQKMSRKTEGNFI